MQNKIKEILKPLYGLSVCRKMVVGNNKYLAIGFGKKIYHHNAKLVTKYYGEWEINSYYGNWRILRGGTIILGNKDVYPAEETNKLLKKIDFGKFISIRNNGKYSVEISFDNDIVVQFLFTTSDDDEFLTIFCPENKYIFFTSDGKWKMRIKN